MAATVSAWSKPGAWALESEENEEELLQQQNNNHNNDQTALAGKPLADFPSLAVAAATKPKKKKGQTFSLQEFTAAKTLPSDPIVLPTGPRQRTAEELERDRLGGGFRSYGDRPGRNSGGGDESSNSRWGSSRVSDETRRNGGFRDSSRREELAPSRADEIDNWASAKKSSAIGNGFERRERERSGGFFDSQSRADESDSWVSNKSYVPSSEGRRFGSNGGGERERRVVGFGSSGGADSDNWNRKKGEFNGGIEKTESGGGRPRLVLQPRSASVSNEIQEGSAAAGNVAKPKGSNPFGEARPREQVLEEKGQDWKKIDEELEAMKLKEAAEKREGFGKRGFGSGNGRASLPEDRTERSWRKAGDESESSKAGSDDGRPESAEIVDEEQVAEN